MAWFDTGVNLLDKRFDIEEVLSSAKAANVHDLLIISSDLDESINAQKCVSKLNSQPDYPTLHYTAGVHPHYADQCTDEHLSMLNDICSDKALFAIGECGLDFNRNFSSQENQLFVFEQQLKIASKFGLGVYLHERDAFTHQIELLKKYINDLPFAIAHCFTGNNQQLNEYLSLGCYIGITGWLCDDNKAETLQSAVKDLPLTHLLLETDAPYLFPKNVRPRKRNNEPKYIGAIADKLSELTGLSISDIESAAFDNAKNLVNSRYR